jgi:hypothetical protein
MLSIAVGQGGRSSVFMADFCNYQLSMNNYPLILIAHCPLLIGIGAADNAE